MTTIPSFQEKMVKTQQQARVLGPVQRQNSSEKISETLRAVVGGTDPTPRRISLGSKSKVGTITDLERGENSDPLLYPLR